MSYVNLEELIKKYDRNWFIISRFKIISNLSFFFYEFQDKVDWGWICLKQKMSEDFIKEFKDKVIWSLKSISIKN